MPDSPPPTSPRHAPEVDPASPAEGLSPLRRGGALRGIVLLYILALVYASLAPFVGWQMPTAFTLFSWPRYWTTFDVLINVVAYAPLGALLARWFDRAGCQAMQTCGRSVLIAFALSLALEVVQAWLPGRVSSPVDLIANVAGGLAGAWFMTSQMGQKLRAGLVLFRSHALASRASTDWGLVLIGVWLVAQLNPAIPFFEAGLLASIPDESGSISHAASVTGAYDLAVLLPQVLGIALNVTALALLISLVVHPSGRAMRGLGSVLVVLAVGFVAKLAMASLMLKAPQLVSQLSPATVIGVTSGVIVFVFFSGRTHRWRAFWTAIFVFAGGVMVKLSSVYAALDQALRLFNWPHGQLANFASLTRWLNEVWPLAVLLFAAIVFVSTESES